ncbi:MAG TPA: tryptophan synthase subunit beta, partial [Pseudonocardiaceae bacterium]
MTDQEQAQAQHPDEHDPDERGYYGAFGGRFMPEALIAALDELSA